MSGRGDIARIGPSRLHWSPFSSVSSNPRKEVPFVLLASRWSRAFLLLLLACLLGLAFPLPRAAASSAPVSPAAEPALWSVARAEVVLSPGPTSVACQARFQVRLLEGTHLPIALLTGSFTVESVSASARAHVTCLGAEAAGERGKVGDQAGNQQLVCVLDSLGEETVTVTFRVPAERTEQGLRFTAPLAEAVQTELHLQLADPNYRVETDPQAVLSPPPDRSQTPPPGPLADFVIRPLHSGPVTVTVTPLGFPGDELTYSESHSLSTWEGKSGYFDLVDLSFSGPEPAQPLEVGMPEGGAVREVKSSSPLTWSLSADGRRLMLGFGGGQRLRQTVSVVLDLSSNPDDPLVSLGSMEVRGARRRGGSLSLHLGAEEVEARGLARSAAPSDFGEASRAVPRYEFDADGFSARFRLVSPKVFLQAEMTLDAHLERGAVRCVETVNFTSVGGPVREFRLRLPEGAEVRPEGIPEGDLWWVTEGTLVVRPGNPPAGGYRLCLQYEVPLSDLWFDKLTTLSEAEGSRVLLPVFEPVADELRGQVRLFLEPGLTAQVLESSGLSAMPRASTSSARPSRVEGRNGVEPPKADADEGTSGGRSGGAPASVTAATSTGSPEEAAAPARLSSTLRPRPEASSLRPPASGHPEPALVYSVIGRGVRLLLEVRHQRPMVEVRTLTLVMLQGDRVLMHVTVVGSIATVSLSELHLKLPVGFLVTEVAGSPSVSWETVGDGTVLRLVLPATSSVESGQKYLGDFRLELEAERARGREETTVLLAPLVVKEATRTTAYLAVATERDLAVTAEASGGLLPIPRADVAAVLGPVPEQALCYRSVAGADEAGGEVRLRIAPVELAARARSTTVLHFTQGLLSVTSRVSLTVSKGGLETVDVVLPPGSADIAISGPLVKGAELVDEGGAASPGVLPPVSQDRVTNREASVRGQDPAERGWRVRFAGKVYDQTDLTVEYKSIINQAQQLVTYPGVVLVGVPQTGSIVVATDPDFQVEERETAGLTPTLGKGAPGYGELVDGRALYGYSFERVPFRLSLLTTRLARAETVQARASAAQLTTVIADRETAVSRMLYFVENPGRKQFVVVRLGPECSLWSTTANGIPVKPAQSADGSLLIPIAEKSQQSGTVQVELVFAEPVPKLGTIAPRLALRSPGLDIPVEDLRWDVYAPKGYFLFGSRGEVVPYDTPEVPTLRALVGVVLSWLPGAWGEVLKAVGEFLQRFWWLFGLIAIIAVPFILRYVFHLRVSVVGYLLVLFILFVLAAMMMPALSRAREAAWASNTRANLKQIGMALFMYTDANESALPISTDQLVGYLEGRAIFGNPASPGTGYVYVQGLPPLSEIGDPQQAIVAFEEAPGRPEGTAVLYLDGHVSVLPKTPEQIQEQVAQEFAGRPVGFEVVRAEALAGEAAGIQAQLGLAYGEAPLTGAVRKEAAQAEFQAAQRQQLAEQTLKAERERALGQKVAGKEAEEAFAAATVVRIPAAQPVADARAGRATGALPMLLSLPTGGERYRLYQPFVEREPGGFALALLARRPFQWLRALLFLAVASGLVAAACRWPRGVLAGGGATVLVLLLVELTSTEGVRLLSEAALGATVVALVAAGVIYQRRQSGKEMSR